MADVPNNVVLMRMEAINRSKNEDWAEVSIEAPNHKPALADLVNRFGWGGNWVLVSDKLNDKIIYTFKIQDARVAMEIKLRYA